MKWRVSRARMIPGSNLPIFLVLLIVSQEVLAQTVHTLPLVMSASNPVQEGFVRIINRTNRSGAVLIHAIDDSGRRFGPASLSLDAKKTVQFNSEDLERGNRSKGLSAGVGSGDGNWRLELDTELDIEPLGYIRTSNGFLTSMHDIVTGRGSACPPTGTRLTDIHVPIFNPASNRSQRSWLRLINPGDRAVNVTISGEDAAGEAPPEGNVRLVVPAGAARAVTAQALESGGADLDGRFGDGAGKWRLFVSADGVIEAMNLLQSATGNLTNLSTTTREEEAPEAPRAGSTSYELQNSTRRINHPAFVSLEGGLNITGAIAYGDFDCDGDEDYFNALVHTTATWDNDGSTPVQSTPVRIYANDGNGVFTLATERFITGPIPEAISGRKALTGDFNGDGRPDVLVADHGADFPPYPGAPPVLLLSSDDGLRAGGLEDVVGFHHGAASGDIDHDGDLDVFMTGGGEPDFFDPVFLMNDGLGNFVLDLNAVPSELMNRSVYTTEIIDVDEDGYLDLLVAGGEFDEPPHAQPSAIYWGDDSGGYDASRMTALPAVEGWGFVVDIDAEDLDGDGDRDIVLGRTRNPSWSGHYIQIVANHGLRRFADETARRITGGTDANAHFIEGIRLEDVDDDGDRDIWIDDFLYWGRTWVNDGSGRFTAPVD